MQMPPMDMGAMPGAGMPPGGVMPSVTKGKRKRSAGPKTRHAKGKRTGPHSRRRKG